MEIDYNSIISSIAVITTHAFIISLIFGVCAKMCRFALDMILNRNINL